jgi:SAM-dependent methyltransferase
MIAYDHAANHHAHSVEGADAALRTLFPDGVPGSILDVGCGTGTWLRAALDLGSNDVFGVDGVAVPVSQLLIAPKLFRQYDLNQRLDLGRRFDLVLCLETAEHLRPGSAATLIDTLAAHSDTILFSAATPGQPGTNHLNCQWPAYWQELFNARGFVCSDAVRWQIWNDARIEPWYRQNLMLAECRPERAGKESRIQPVIHPAMVDIYSWDRIEGDRVGITQGSMPLAWYVTAPLKAAAAKMRRRLGGR